MKTSDWILMVGLLIVLAGAFSGFGFWRTQRIFKEDSTTITYLKNAIGSYILEYRKAPWTNGNQQSDVEFSSDLQFMKCVSGGEDESSATENPRGIVFFYRYPGKRERRAYVRGSELQLLAKDLRDSYGEHYQIRIDADGDGKVACPQTNELLDQQVLIWSAGKDGNPETWQDNITTWER